MLLHEILAPADTFYLGSHIPLSDRISRHDLRMDVHPRHHAVESVLERARPSGGLSRSECVFLAHSPHAVATLGMPTTHLYEVRPIGPVQRSDQRWWHMILAGLSYGQKERPPVEEWATQYWTGAECPTGMPLWEYRAKAVLVLR